MRTTNKPQSAVPSQRPKAGFSAGPKNNNYLAGPAGAGANIAVIVKKFKMENLVPEIKKHDREVANFPRNTLLEPNNIIPSWEAGGEEQKEVSATLKALRQKYDKVHRQVLERQQYLKQIQHDLEKAGEEELYLQEKNENENNEDQTKSESLEMITEEHEFEKLTEAQYEHMLQRMKADLLASQLMSQELKESFRSKETIAGEEAAKLQKAVQDRIQAKMKLEQIMMEIDKGQKERQERMGSLQKSLKNKEEALRRRVQRVNRQQEIAENAANENKDQNEIKAQEAFLVQRLLSSFLKKKMEREMKQNQEVEDAFQKIRTDTGVSDVNEIVHKFLTREQTYSQLLMAVSENERKSDNLRIDHEDLAAKLHDLQIDDENVQNGNQKTEGKENAAFSPEIEELDKEIQLLNKEKEKSELRAKKVHLVFEQVQGWCSKVIQKIDQQFGENIGQFEHKNTLGFLFEKIQDAVCRQLEIIINEEDDEDRGFITAKDFMNDFAVDVFMNKNIRVRPLSGVTKTEDEGKTNDPYAKSGTEGQDDEEKFAFEKNLEMDEQRKETKKKKKEWIDKKRQEEEKAAKKRR